MENYAHGLIGVAIAMIVMGIFFVVVVWHDTITSNREWDKKHKDKP